MNITDRLRLNRVKVTEFQAQQAFSSAEQISFLKCPAHRFRDWDGKVRSTKLRVFETLVVM